MVSKTHHILSEAVCRPSGEPILTDLTILPHNTLPNGLQLVCYSATGLLRMKNNVRAKEPRLIWTC